MVLDAYDYFQDHSKAFHVCFPTVNSLPMALRSEIGELPAPRTIPKALVHPESTGYLPSLASTLRARCCTKIPENINIGDIPPKLILQLMPSFTKKYVGMDFSKFKCRLVVLGNKWKNLHNPETYFRDGFHGYNETVALYCCYPRLRYDTNGSRLCILNDNHQ